ncbi:hypothetical protein SAMN05216203_0611 [Marinobacter daqiaonensis]|uniref:Uncharacterized protein n=1 Tax=Marinobacter daqiaonensis TaxID=650891 RepID=A0A1I6GYI2_9GAMM|nr:hypothetical protein SAMN05216203_0611 [Marinobacter daqiaonensis]
MGGKLKALGVSNTEQRQENRTRYPRTGMQNTSSMSHCW